MVALQAKVRVPLPLIYRVGFGEMGEDERRIESDRVGLDKPRKRPHFDVVTRHLRFPYLLDPSPFNLSFKVQTSGVQIG